MTIRRGVGLVCLLVGTLLVASQVSAGFAGSDVFLAMAGRGPGVFPSNWYTTVWIHNPSAEAATARIFFLQRGSANFDPPWVDVSIAAGDTEAIENVVESLFGVQVFGALRVTCATAKLQVTSRVYSADEGQGERDSLGQEFVGVPASFAIGTGEKSQILGIDQTQPAESSACRYNFGFVETAGHSANVRVSVYDGNNAFQGSKDFNVREWSQRQVAFKDHFPAVSTLNSRLELEVVSGAGRVIAYGSMVANGTQDPTTFEMAYPERVLAENLSPGITEVVAGQGLSGGGTTGVVTLEVGAGDGIAVDEDAVSIAHGGVTPGKIAPSAVPGQVLATIAAGASAPGQSTFAASGTTVAWQDLVPGPSGPPGPQGTTGAQGPQGEAGLTGPAGETGPAGPQGEAGMTGATGAVGPQGPQGATGPEGPTGPRGLRGATGPVGPTGAQGIQGATGPVGPTGAQGTQGETGPIGPSGPQGIQGAIGPIGPQGIQGDIGPIGPSGPQGIQGDIGPIGPSGPQGIQGDIGPIGPSGPQGIQGDIGPIGPTGAQGAQGAMGPSGPSGPIGPQGPAGPVAGSDAQVIYNNGGVAGGTAAVHYDDVNGRLGIGTGTPGSTLHAQNTSGQETSRFENLTTGVRTYAVIGTTASTTGGTRAGYFHAQGESGNTNAIYAINSSDTSNNAPGYFAYTSAGTHEDPDTGGTVPDRTYTGMLTGVWADLPAGNTNGSSTAGFFRNRSLTGTGYAGWFVGNVLVQGTLSKSAGSFTIDHPLDPASRTLSHSFVESPDMMNVYNGNVVLDENGQAWVQLPEWFEALNSDFRYQLTCIGGFAPVYVATEIGGNRFRVAGGTPALKVSWQVTGIRRDAYAERNRIAVENDKEEPGAYLCPECFPASRTSVAAGRRLEDKDDSPSR